MDESYVNINRRDNVSYSKDGDNKTEFASGGKGKRIIVIHAIGIEGALVSVDEQGFPVAEG